jgi:hypothetical protein
MVLKMWPGGRSPHNVPRRSCTGCVYHLGTPLTGGGKGMQIGIGLQNTLPGTPEWMLVDWNRKAETPGCCPRAPP